MSVRTPKNCGKLKQSRRLKQRRRIRDAVWYGLAYEKQPYAVLAGITRFGKRTTVLAIAKSLWQEYKKGQFSLVQGKRSLA